MDNYFNELVDIVDGQKYTCLLRQLYLIDFYSSVLLDEKLFEKTQMMRYEKGVTRIEEVSVFEIFVRLAIDAEHKVMHNTAFGNRTAEWFWLIMRNLNFDKFTDDIYNDDISETVISRIDMVLSRTYSRNGVGGPFRTNTRKDCRKADLWRQMNWQLSELYSDETHIDMI